MSETLLRQWAMLRMIPRAPRKISTAEIRSRLDSEYGYHVNVRTLQRDLERLSAVFELERDDRSKPYGWSWRKMKALEITPSMDTDVALTFYLAEQQLKRLLPSPALQHLRPYFDVADTVLKSAALSPLSQWRSKVRALPEGQRLIPAKVQTKVLETVYEALLENRRFCTLYRARDSEASSSYEVNPLGLVVRNAITYLVCTLWDYTDVRVLSLHRMDKPEHIDAKATKPRDFSLDRYIESGAFGFPCYDGDIRKIRLKAIFEPSAAYHLQELKLSTDQMLTEQTDGRILLEATVLQTGELEWWLQAFGDLVEVTAPKSLRDAFRAASRRMAKLYKQ